MGGTESKPIHEFTKEEISFAVANLGEAYSVYVDTLSGNGVDGQLLDALGQDELEETLDDLDITNRLHRRVLKQELNRVKCGVSYVATAYDYGPSTPQSELEPYQQITSMCIERYAKTVVMAGVYLVLNDGNQFSLDTKKLKDGVFVSETLHCPRGSSFCSSMVQDGSNQEYYKSLLPREYQKQLFDDPKPCYMTLTCHIVKDDMGKRQGMVCMIDCCSPSDIIDEDRETFLRQLASDTANQLRLRKVHVDKRRQQQQPINNRSLLDMKDDHNEILLPAVGPIKPVLKSQVTQRLTNKNPLSFGLGRRASHLLPMFQNMSTETDRAHLPLNFFDCADTVSCPRPPIPKNDMECTAAVETLALTEMNPDDDIAVQLKQMVKIATQIFGFPNAEITFRNHDSVFCLAGHGESESICGCFNLYPTLKRNKDGTQFLWSMPRALAVCNYVIASSRSFIVHDLAADESFQWLAAKVPFQCYAGTAIKDSCGRAIAVLCMFDSKPRPDFQTAHEIQLEQLACLISQCIENWALQRSIEQLEKERKKVISGRDKQIPPNIYATLVLTDIEGWMDILEANPAVMQRGQRLHDGIIKELCAHHFGCEVNTDEHSFAFAFHDPVDAFGFALEAQIALHVADWPDELLQLPQAKVEAGAFRGLRVKMAVHQGRFCPREDEDSRREIYTRATFNITKNLLELAQGGQILATAETWDVASYFIGSMLSFPQVLDHGSHVIRKGKTTRDGVVTKRIIQLVPSKLAYDYFAARKISVNPEEERPDTCFPGRHFPPIISSLKKVSPSFHDAPFIDNVVTMAFVNLSAIDDDEAASVVNLIGTLLDGMPEFGGYQCQSEMLAFQRPIDAILFGLRLQDELANRSRQNGSDLAKLITYACMSETFLTMGPHRTTGRADYFGKIVNRSARLSKAVASGSVCFGVVCGGKDAQQNDRVADQIKHPLLLPKFKGKKRLKGVSEEVCIYECKSISTSNRFELRHGPVAA